MAGYSILKATKQRKFNRKIFGFDIETYNDNKDFLMCSIYAEDYKKVFYSKSAFIEEIKTNRIFKNSYLFATNLSFDFFGIFFNSEEIQNMTTLFRGSDLLKAKAYLYRKEFTLQAKHNTKANPSITFIDTMNYAKLSVANMGKIVGMPKFKTPSFIGQKPRTEEEWDEMRIYNIQDSIVTYTFAKFLVNAFEELGGTFKDTLASSSMALFKNKYLKQDFFRLSEENLLEIFEAYYGGRTEAFKRGYFTEQNYYDFNSLYPSVMAQNVFPDPNSHRITRKNTIKYINKFEGVSKVRIEIPKDTHHPLLPLRNETGRVIFPTGTIEGWYSHIEIREAIKDGAVLIKVHKTHYFKKNCSPFEGYVNDLYNKRLEYKKTNNPMEYVTKIMLNSLYGKFGQRFTDKDNWVPKDSITYEKLEKCSSYEVKGEYIRICNNKTTPSAFCVPIWAIYVTAYGRIKLHKAIKECDPIYCDTDSLITDKTLPTSDKLGDLKLEMEISEGVVVRPKFYALREKGEDEFTKGYVKIKGLGKRLTYLEFWGFLQKPTITYDKFTKFKEALRRNLIPNEIIKITKELSLEDEKRIWPKEFNDHELQLSKPLNIKL